MLTRLENTESQGRLVIDLEKIIKEGEESKIVVKSGDQLFIPEIPYAVSVSGEVQFPTSHLHDEKLDLNRYLIKNKESSFFVRVSGDSMINVGIFNNDILIVDKSLTPGSRSIVIASIDGELIIKRLVRDKFKNYYLKSENNNYPNIKLKRAAQKLLFPSRLSC